MKLNKQAASNKVEGFKTKIDEIIWDVTQEKAHRM